MNVPATEMKNRFGRYLEVAANEPVVVEKAGRPVAVLLSFEEYQRLEQADDAFWSARAEAALSGGFADRLEVERLLRRFQEPEPDAQA